MSLKPVLRILLRQLENSPECRLSVLSRARCYDFKNIFVEKFGEKFVEKFGENFGVFYSTQS
jgi:hypothetical protein